MPMGGVSGVAVFPNVPSSSRMYCGPLHLRSTLHCTYTSISGRWGSGCSCCRGGDDDDDDGSVTGEAGAGAMGGSQEPLRSMPRSSRPPTRDSVIPRRERVRRTVYLFLSEKEERRTGGFGFIYFLYRKGEGEGTRSIVHTYSNNVPTWTLFSGDRPTASA